MNGQTFLVSKILVETLHSHGFTSCYKCPTLEYIPYLYHYNTIIRCSLCGGLKSSLDGLIIILSDFIKSSIQEKKIFYILL